MADIQLNCVECKNDFYWKESDQKFYAEKGFQTPKRCWHCRQKRKTNGSQATEQKAAPALKKQPPATNHRYREDSDDDF